MLPIPLSAEEVLAKVHQSDLDGEKERLEKERVEREALRKLRADREGLVSPPLTITQLMEKMDGVTRDPEDPLKVPKSKEETDAERQPKPSGRFPPPVTK